ncbi:glycosyltransferase 87 family protein [Streptomyces sp. HNM0663]|uniref:Glycosyltransferase 87 family protein n=1 Tax=Streptomyces chengmaiensis TaxID=3040919 RepID=A0ABT6HG26_9ACTN|nr:glycosyltransferase 87 family protein [Streptomyces chengmaiensis]MDH2387719.1 glycosyltransferase 87 family protein [Streptomyces chengmaiensis]
MTRSGIGSPSGRPLSTRARALLVAALALATGIFLITVPLHREWFDLGVYRGAVTHWRSGGPLYDYVVPGTHYGFTYPPFAALCMLPMTLVGWHQAVVLSLLLNALAGAAILALTAGAAVRRQGWSRWYAFAVAGCLFALLEPVRDTISFGQVNLLLLTLVLTDARLLAAGGGRGRFAGIGIGLAAAIKLTPAVFILYLFVTRRLRAALVASAVALGATLFALWAAPGASRHYWTQAMWDTDRVGALAYVSNQSWQGVLARLADPGEPSRTAWAVGVAVLLALWAWRARQAAAAGNELAGFALTGLTACLISPVTWVHHLVWTVPALIVLADSGLLSADAELRRRRLAWAAALYVILCSSVIWLWSWDAAGADGFLGGNAYVWICLGLLLALPVRASAPADDSRRHLVAGGSATMGACAHATEYPLESRQSALPGSSTPPGSKPAPSASGE